MNISVEVAKVVWAKGKATMDEVHEVMGDQLTRQQVLKGLANAKARGLLEVVGTMPPLARGGTRVIYARPVYGAEKAAPKAARKIPVKRPVTSVWECAAVETVAEWPLPFDGGRVVNVLGSWA
jgi:hypothetical protein